MQRAPSRTLPGVGGTELLLLALSAFPALALDPPVLLWQNAGCRNSYCETGWYTSPAIADVNRDGVVEVIGGSYARTRLDGRFHAYWLSRTEPAVAELDGDGQAEVLVASRPQQAGAPRGRLFVLSASGVLLHQGELPPSMIRTASATRAGTGRSPRRRWAMSTGTPISASCSKPGSWARALSPCTGS